MTSNTTPATPAQTTPAPRRLTLRRESLIVALGAVGAGVIFLAPVAQADTPGTDPGGTTAPGGASPAPGVDVTADADFTPVLNDPNYYGKVGAEAGDQFVGGTTAVATATVGGPYTVFGQPLNWLDPGLGFPEPLDQVEAKWGGNGTLRLCITCR